MNSFDEKELRLTETYQSSSLPSSTYISQMKMKFTIQQIVTGIHFRFPFTYVNSYGGIGAGLW